MTNDERRKIALVIDADNVAARHADAMMAEIAKHGEAVLRRVYGDFSTPSMKGWVDKLSRHALVPVQSVQRAKGKNSTDIEMVIDVMDMLHSKAYDAFFIVSSDSDFTRLAQRLREGGVEVYCIGEAKTSDSLRQSCRRFFLLENIAREYARAADEAEPELGLPVETGPQPVAAAVPYIQRAYDSLVGEHGDGWVPIRKMQQTIANMAADFDTRTYGFVRLGDLAVKTGRYDIVQRQDRGWWVREREVAAADGVRRTVAKTASADRRTAPTVAKQGVGAAAKPGAGETTRRRPRAKRQETQR